MPAEPSAGWVRKTESVPFLPFGTRANALAIKTKRRTVGGRTYLSSRAAFLQFDRLKPIHAVTNYFTRFGLVL
jgi:hypothetical protein